MHRLPIKRYAPIASVAALSERLAGWKVIGQHRRPYPPCRGGGMPLPALHCRPVQAAVKMVMASDLSLRGGRRPTWQSRAGSCDFAGGSPVIQRSGTSAKRTITLPRPEAASRSIPMEPLNKSAAALSGSFAPTYRFENLEILRSRWRLCRLTDAACPLRVHKVFLQFPNLNLEQNPSLTALAI